MTKKACIDRRLFVKESNIQALKRSFGVFFIFSFAPRSAQLQPT